MSDRDTKQQCLACGGHWKVGGAVCRWCDGGLMTLAQRATWLKHRSGPRVVTDPNNPTPSPSSASVDVRQATLIARIAKAREKRPDLSFTEFIYEVLVYHRVELAMLPLIDDKRFAELCERFSLLGP